MNPFRAIRTALSRRRHARDDLKRNARFGRGLQFFAASAKNKRVAALQANHRFALFRCVHQQTVDLLLRYGYAGSAFTDADCLRVPAHQFTYFRGDQVVVKHHVRLLKGL